MKLSIIVFLFILAFVLPVYAAKLDAWRTDVNINPDGTTEWNVLFDYTEPVKQSSLFVPGEIWNVRVLVNDKSVTPEITKHELGQIIYVSLTNETDNIAYNFKTRGYIDIANRFRTFRYRFPIIHVVDNLSFTIKLPIGAIIAKKEDMPPGMFPFEPNFGEEGTDGRRIFLIWRVEKPELGRTIDFHLIYEQSISLGQMIVIIITAIAVIGMIIVIMFRRNKIKNVLPVLTEGERRVMEILLREGKEVDQRTIVRETDYSKSKVSRIIQGLESRGLVERSKKGRANKLRILRKAK